MCLRDGHPRSRQAIAPVCALFALSIILALFCLHDQATAAELDPSQNNPESEVVLMLELDGETVNDSLLAVERSGRLFIPVCAIAEAVSLSINCLEDRAYGFILQESRPFLVDIKEGYAISGRKVFKMHGEAVMHGAELLVDSQELSRWLPVDFKYVQKNSSLRMLPREVLPVQGFKKRQKFRRPPAPIVPRHFDDFTPGRGMASVPTVDLISQLQLAETGRGVGGLATRTMLGLSGDLLYMSSEAHLAAENEAIKRLDLTLSRRSDAGFKVGPLPVTQFLLGAVQASNLDGIGAESTPMYGFAVSNRPLSEASKFLSHDINGYLPAGWDAELFRNGSPLGYQPPTQDGMYHFENLRLQYGINAFKIILHGPFGETREFEQTIVSDAITPTGEFLYNLSAAWQTGLTRSSDQGGAGTGSSVTMTSDFGVSKDLTGSALLVRQTDGFGAERDFAGVGIRSAMGYTLMSLDLIQSFSVSGAGYGQLLTARSSSREVFGMALDVEQRLFHDFDSLRYLRGSNPVSQTLVKGSGSVSGWNSIRFPVSVAIGVDMLESGETDSRCGGGPAGGEGGTALLKRTFPTCTRG